METKKKTKTKIEITIEHENINLMRLVNQAEGLDKAIVKKFIYAIEEDMVEELSIFSASHPSYSSTILLFSPKILRPLFERKSNTLEREDFPLPYLLCPSLLSPLINLTRLNLF